MRRSPQDATRYKPKARPSGAGKVSDRDSASRSLQYWQIGVSILSALLAAGALVYSTQMKSASDAAIESLRRENSIAHVAVSFPTSKASKAALLNTANFFRVGESAGVVDANTGEPVSTPTAGAASLGDEVDLALRTVEVDAKNERGVEATSVRINLTAPVALVSIDPQFPHDTDAQVRFSPDRHSAIVELKTLAVNDVLVLNVVLTASLPPSFKSADQLVVRAVCQNCDSTSGP